MDKLLLSLAAILALVTVVVVILMYYLVDDTIKFDAPWAIAAYVGTILTGAAAGASFGLYWKTRSNRLSKRHSKRVQFSPIEETITEPIDTLINF